VQPAVGGDGELDHRRAGVVVGDVDADGRGRSPVIPDAGRGRLGPVEILVGEYDARPLTGERLRGRQADAARRTGDQDAPAVEPGAHADAAAMSESRW